MSAQDFNAKSVQDGTITVADITQLVEFWQRNHPPLAVDGYCGPNTLASLRAVRGGAIKKCWPLLPLVDGRKPIITSGFYTENPSRSTHMGVDLMFLAGTTDQDLPIGDGEAYGRSHIVKYFVPEGAVAVAAASGRVSIVGRIKTGHRVWIEHEDGNRSGYFHLSDTFVEPGEVVEMGIPIGTVGDNPSAYDPRHLHFEVSPIDKYAPKNPRVWLETAIHLV